MRESDVGAIPVKADSRLVGMVTDRDIACRAFADSVNLAKMTAQDIMTKDVICCSPDDDIEVAIYSGILLKLVGAIERRHVGGCGQAAPNPSIGAFASIILASSSSSSPPLAKIVTSCRPPSFRMRRTRFDNTIRSPLSRRTARTAIPACFRRGASLTTFRAAASVS